LIVLAPLAPAASRVHLPAPGDIPPAIDPASLLGPKPGSFPNKAPGAISGEEVVRVGLAPDGAVRSLVVDQELDLTGSGDYTLEITGPALDVGSSDPTLHPGLRLGSLIWEGFSPGGKHLQASVTLDPTTARFLPIPLKVTVGSSGARITNVTAQPRRILLADVDRAELGALLDRMRALARSGVVPRAGYDGIPTSLAARSSAREELVDVAVPFHVVAELSAPDAETSRDATTTLSTPGEGVDLPFDGRLIAAPELRIQAAPVAAPFATLDPPGGARTWRAALARAQAREVRDGFVLAQVVLWQGLRVADYQAFLGTPLGGTFRATYEFAPATVEAAPTPRAPPERVRPMGIALALVAAALIAGNGVALWRRA